MSEVEEAETFAQVEDLEVRVLDDDEAWPKGYKEEKLLMRRVDDGFILAAETKSGVAVRTIAAPTGAAWEVFNTLMNVLSNIQAEAAIQQDLAWRWYRADSTKREKKPLHANPNFTQLGAGALTTYDEWERYFNQFWPLQIAYTLRTFDQNGAWTVTGRADLEAYQEYAQWYNYFEAVQTGGGTSLPGNTDNGDYVKIALGKSFTSTSELSYKNYFDGVMSNYGPNGNATSDMPEYMYVNLPKAELAKAVNSIQGSYSLFVNVNFGSSSSSVVVTAVPAGTESLEWGTTTLSGSEYPHLTIVRTGAHYQYYKVYNNVTIGSEVNLPVTNASYRSYYIDGSSRFTATGTYYSVSMFDGTYTPEPEPSVPTDPVYKPVITGPVITPPTPPTSPTSGIVSNPVVTDLEDFQNWLASALETYFGDVIKWLQLIADWESTISGQITDFRQQVADFGTQVIKWLEAIYYKPTGGGSGVNPVSNPDENIEWWQKLLEWLMGNLPSAISDLLFQLGRLNDRFPFSIPWDVGLILGIFDQAPETPVFDVTLSYPTRNWTWTQHIDLSYWDQVARIFRAACELSFAMTLLMWTPYVLDRNMKFTR